MYFCFTKHISMNKGKVTCETLKSIRKQIADANGIPYTPAECSYEGDCIGTCPNCERERQYIESQLSKKHQSGKSLKIIGVAASVTALLTCQETRAEEIVSPDSSVQQKFEMDYYCFDFNGSISPEKLNFLDEMAEIVSEYPNDTFLVVGHSDSRGSHNYNKKLTQKRAEYVKDLFVARGADPDKIIAIGAGSTEPIIPNAQNEVDHEQNRRATLEFYSKERENEIVEKIKNAE